MIVRIYRYPAAADLPLKATPGAAGHDLSAAHPAVVAPGDRTLIGTGYAIEIPSGYEGQIRPRSGLAVKHGVVVFNGTIDSDYRGEIKVLLFNYGSHPFYVEFGDRIAQLVISPVVDWTPVEVESLVSTERGEGGFGSTGV